MSRELIHYGIHFLLPVLIGILAFPQFRWKAVLILLGGILIDVDHLLANPVFDPDRCSIGFHPLHSYWAIGIYCLLLLPSKTRIWGLAFMLHILADTVDCLLI
ncbi:DUF6122 family protein [Flavobacteriaceae bacterium D16]|nr:DUF6122 family protein [Flavobacteriaceae bacterium D16]